MKNRQLQSDSRAWPRAIISTTANILINGKISSAYKVENLCASGALISGGPALQVDAKYRFEINLPNMQPVAVTARVVRRRLNTDGTSGYGIAFQGISADTEDCIHSVILAQLETRLDASPSVLVVDDCANIRNAMKRELHDLGLQAVLAAMPLDAMRVLHDEDLQIGVAIVDLFLGSADGLQLLKVLAKNHPHIRRILISGESRSCQLDLALDAGHAHAVLSKPWDRAQMAKAVAC